MRAQVLNEGPERIYAVVFDIGEDPIGELTRFAEDHALAAAAFTAIGAFSEAVLGYFDWERKDYERTAITEQVEVLSMIGDIAVEEASGRRKVHAHAVLGKRGGAACGGHLLSAKVRPTLEVILTESPAYLRRVHDPRSGLALIRIGG